MTLIRFEPHRSFEKLSKRLNELSDEMEKGVSFEIGGFNPRIDITEDDEHLFIDAELPGVDKKNVKISVNEDRMLTIRGEKEKTKKAKEKNYHRTERVFGEFERSFQMPENLDLEKINAKYDDGVLKVSIPKVEPPKPKEINIDVE